MMEISIGLVRFGRGAVGIRRVMAGSGRGVVGNSWRMIGMARIGFCISNCLRHKSHCVLVPM